MKFLVFIFFLSLSFADDSGWWGCHDESALNYNPYSWDCGGWCCEYEDCNDYGIVINEINYNPASSFNQSDEDYEFIELYNNGLDNVDLHGWSLSNSTTNICFTFDDLQIEAGQYLVIARNPSTYPNSIDFGLHNSLSNSEATLTLRDSHHNTIDQVSYKDNCDCDSNLTCWPTNSDAGGATLELKDPNLSNNLGVNWQDSFVIPGGTPGYQNSTEEGQIFGCTDSNACNFDLEATADDGSCDYAAENFDCDGNCLVELDCFGECGGSATLDCFDECGGEAVIDDCGECGGSGPAENFDCDGNCLVELDCFGECGGSAALDCFGECGGDAVIDECGECDGSGIPEGECDCNGNILDCFGECGGDAVVDSCGDCGGNITDEDDCPIYGFEVSFGDFDIENRSVDINLSNESDVAGFQFSISGLDITEVTALSAGNYDFSISNSETTVIGFSLSGGLIPPSNSSIIRIFYSNQYDSEICINDPVFSDPDGNEIDIEVGECLAISACTDIEACNYFDYNYTCLDCCFYAQEYWLDTDGDGLGYLENGSYFCEDPGTEWVTNHGDEYPNCFSNIVDSCGQCDGDNSVCSGCTDELAFNYSCLNGNWPTSATYGCTDEVLVDDGSCIYPPNGFSFIQSTRQAFYEFENASFNDMELEFMGSWIGAFRDGVCVGSWPWVGQFTTVPVMGWDESEYSENYMQEGEFPEFYIYDPILDDSFPAVLSEENPFINLEFYHIDSITAVSNNWSDYGFMLGDVNVDYQVNIVDITNQVNFVLELDTPTPYQIWAADMNLDSSLNVADVVYLSNHVLGLARVSLDDGSAYINNNTLEINEAIGGIQFTGQLLSSVSQSDVIKSNGDKTIIYALDGAISTSKFVFQDIPSDLVIVDTDGAIITPSSQIVASGFALENAYPNPFNPSTVISFEVPYSSNVRLDVYNVKGEYELTLTDEVYSKGSYNVEWNANSFSSGLYFVRMISGDYISMQKLMLVK